MIEQVESNPKELVELFDALNQEFWDSRLPDTTLSWGPLNGSQKAASDPMGSCGKPEIRILPRYKEKGYFSHGFVRELMLHEMCHIAAFQRGETAAHPQHGPVFCRELEKLAPRGEKWAKNEAMVYKDLLAIQQP